MKNAKQIASASPSTDVSYRYAIDYFKLDGTRLGPISIEPDFQSVKDWTYFKGVRSGQLPAVTAAAQGRVRPLWCEDRGEPYCQGIRVDRVSPGLESAEASPDDVESISCEFSRSVFKAEADRAAQQWVAKGDLEAGEHYTYFICAYPVASAAADLVTRTAEVSSASVFQVEVVADSIPLVESNLDRFLEHSIRVTGQRVRDAVDPDIEQDIPVFFSQGVIEEASALAEQAGDCETGGVLVGRLHQNGAPPEIFIEIVAQIPARHAEASGTSFSFTSKTWGAAAAAIELRGRDELILGWWHSHPMFCNPQCSEEKRKSCFLASPFFSGDDIHLHQVCFPQPYQVALLISDLPQTGRTPAVFGWHAGMVASLDYYTNPPS